MSLESSPAAPTPPRRRWPARLAAAAGTLALLGLAAYAYLLATSTPVSAEQMADARLALQNPAGASLHVGHYGDDSGWLAPDASGYAVQDGMVLFPEPDTRQNQAALGLAQIELPVLVDAPTGGDLRARPGPPSGRFISADEWFLYKCRPILPHPGWWECGLLFGSLIHQ